MTDSKEVHGLAAFTHGALASLHLLGCVYNLKRRNWYNLGVHSYALAFSVQATVHHSNEVKRKELTSNG